MLRYLSLLLICVCSLVGAAQEQPAAYAVDDNFNLWNKGIGDDAYIFADIAYIRDYPSLQGKVLDSLEAGVSVRILSEGYNNMLIKDFYAPWHKVEYRVGKQKKQGFIWLGLIALNGNYDPLGNLWLYGFNKYPNRSQDEEDYALCQVKLLSPQKEIIGSTSYLVYLMGQSYTEAKVMDNMGLEGLTAIHRVAFNGEACGIPSNYYYIGWTGSEFLSLPGKSSVSDAGVYYMEEKLLFPSEHHLDQNLIIKDIVEGEVIDFDAEVLDYKVNKQRIKYYWNGKVASQIVELK